MAQPVAHQGHRRPFDVSQAELLRVAIELLDRAGIDHMVVGSFASAFHGEPRMTQDIDVVVNPDERSLRFLVDAVDRERFYLGDAVAALHLRGMFNLIEPRTGWKVDFVIRQDRPFSRVEFERRLPVTIAGVDVCVATAEDTILAKLEWAAESGSDQQLRDVISIAASQELERSYLTKWAQELGVAAALADALVAADEVRAEKFDP